MQMQGSFDAAQFAPKQMGTSHPPGKKFPAVITGTSIEPTKDQTGGMFIAEFTTPSGVALFRYNLWNKEPKAVEIAHGQLSALCHATGIFRLDWQNEGAALRNARCCIDVDLQNANEPNGYTQITKVYDANGNEPGKPPMNAPQPQQQPQGQPMQQNPGGGWGSPPPQQQPQQPAQPAGWPAPNNAAPPPASAPPAVPAWAQANRG